MGDNRIGMISTEGEPMIAHIHEKTGIQIGSTLSQNRLAIHAGKSQNWVRLQGNAVNVRGEIWQADFYNGGRIRGYVLAAFAPPSMCAPSTQQQDGAAAMK